jgi:Domain of Unknown Function (DUF928)
MNKILKKFRFVLIMLNIWPIILSSLLLESKIADADNFPPSAPNRGAPGSRISTATWFNLPHAPKHGASGNRIGTSFKLPPAPKRGAPGNRKGAGSRLTPMDSTNESGKSNRRFVALVPEYQTSTGTENSSSELANIWGLTTNKYPTIWFHIPYPQSLVSRIDFTLYNRDNLSNQVFYQESRKPAEKPGLISFSLPKTKEPIAINQLYRWEVKLTLNRELDKEVFVTGWIQRAALSNNLSEKLKLVTPHKQAILYAENGIWYDAISTLAKLRRDLPQDLAIKQDWVDILKSVDLDELSDKPFSPK